MKYKIIFLFVYMFMVMLHYLNVKGFIIIIIIII